MFLSLIEIRDILIMTAVIGYLFHDIFRKPAAHNFDPIQFYAKRGFNYEDFKFAALVTAPAIILHEFGHKFVALAFGATATFNASFFGLGLGVILKLIGSRFLFFVPAYVSISSVPLLPHAAIAFAGPAVNLIIWLGLSYLLKTRKFNRQWTIGLTLTKRINMFLFGFNMLPIPGFDGFQVYASLFSYFF